MTEHRDDPNADAPHADDPVDATPGQGEQHDDSHAEHNALHPETAATPAAASAQAGASAAPPTAAGGQVPPPPGPPPRHGAPPPGAGPYPVPYGPGRKPDQVTIIAVLNLVDGVLNILFAASILFGLGIFGLSTLGCGCLFLPLGLYPLVLGILEIIQGARLLPADARDVTPARWLAVMQIVNVLLGQVVSAAAGVIALILVDQPEVRRWFAERAPRPPAAGTPPRRY